MHRPTPNRAEQPMAKLTFLSSIRKAGGVGKKACEQSKLLVFAIEPKQLTIIPRPRPEQIEFPSPEMADELVAFYFSRVHHTFPILHQQTFVERYIKVMEERQSGQPSEDHAFLSCIFAVFAVGACSKTRQKKSQPLEFGGMESVMHSLAMFYQNTDIG